MDKDKLFLITELEGFAPEIGRLVSMMNYARYTTLATVQGLSMRQLDYVHDANSNSIGALLLHMAAVELGYQLETFYGREPNAEEIEKWQAPFDLGDLGREQIRGKELEYYLHELSEMRKVTLEEFRRRDDSWLYEETPFWRDKPANNYFKWFHVFEDEINHRGQIRWLRQRAIQYEPE
ncbi:DinB family protein [Paenibacillus doosanensis]|uniref:DinB family protein n=1 Tax=Paenibacillus doosanensis TaxID=1229154 RepID=UPI00217F32FF|nr:DinB family protein [Paenibacillus doosanensis]MCS7463308.1 DinB family protein [Paenibacillus doosanensis]